MTVSTLWITFLQALTELDASFAGSLNPPPPHLSSALAALTCSPHTVPAGYAELYGQGDGERGQFSSGVFFGLRFLPLAEAQGIRAQWAAELPDEEDDFLLPQPYHLPVFSDMTGNALCIDLQHGQQTVMVGADYDEPEVLAESLSDLLEWAVWTVRCRECVVVSRLPGFRPALSLSSRTAVPNAVRAWTRRHPGTSRA